MGKLTDKATGAAETGRVASDCNCAPTDASANPAGLWEVVHGRVELELVRKRLRELGDLPPNWDGYGARQVAPAARRRAEAIVEQLVGADTPAPSAVPLADGGVQLEWHLEQIDLELEIGEEDGLRVFFHDGKGDSAEWEDKGVAVDDRRLVQALDTLAARRRAWAGQPRGSA